MIDCKVAKVFPGYLFGFQHPTSTLAFASSDAARDLAEIQAVGEAIESHLQYDARLLISASRQNSSLEPLEAFLALIDGIELSAEVPVFARRIMAAAEQADKAGTNSATVFVECMSPAFTAGSVNLVVGLLDLVRDGISPSLLGIKAEKFVASHMSHPAVANLRKNSRHLARAAHDHSLPVLKLPRGLVQYGWGRKSTIGVSSMTQNTSLVSSQIARDKPLTRATLQAARLPVARQHNVRDLEKAIEAAKKIGYPVVVKPRSLDGGKGVTTNIRDEATLTKAFAKVKELARGVLVEEHIFGGEFRLLVVHGKLIAIHERVPAQVQGNGVDTIAALVETENARRAEIEQTGERAVPILVEDDTAECLAGQGLDMESVPAAGQTVRLATVPKVQTGGDVRPMDVSSFHPDNIEAVLRAARFLRLDIAGVDFLTPDPSISWREGRSAITEVNAVPQINRLETFDVFSGVLEQLLPEGGRLPSVLLIDDSDDAQLVSDIANTAQLELAGLGLLVTNEAHASRWEAEFPALVAVGDGQAVLRDPLVECVLAVQSMPDILSNGFALDRFDLIALRTVPSQEIALQLQGAPFRSAFEAASIVALDGGAGAGLLSEIAGSETQTVDSDSELARLVVSCLKAGND